MVWPTLRSRMATTDQNLWKTDRQTDRHTDAAENPTHANTVCVDNDVFST